MLYRLIARPLLYRLQAETAHRFVVGLLRFASAIPGMRSVMSLVFRTPGTVAIDVLGLHFPTPIGMAAGFDKDAEVYKGLAAIGFGSVEVGTITGEAQPGNPKPRVFRLVRDRALVNRMGFNNHGSEHAARRLSRDRWLAAGRAAPGSRAVVAMNIGKTKAVPAEEAAADYEKSARLLGPHADYLVVNVSSPNTPGLRDLQAVESLQPILTTVRAALDAAVTDRRVPLLVKIAPDLSNEDVLAVADLALDLSLDGIIATNTTIARDGLKTAEADVEACGAGGLSGAPLKRRSMEVLRLLRGRVGDRLVLVAAGGVETVDEAWDRITAGASLVQIYSGMIYQGADMPSRLARGLAKRLAKSPYATIAAAVGTDVS